MLISQVVPVGKYIIFRMNQHQFWIIPFQFIYPHYTHQYPSYSNPIQPPTHLLPFHNDPQPPSQQEIVHVNFDEPVERKQRKNFKRRTQTQLNKCYKCPYENCHKSYASDLAVNLHMKNKHKGGSKKDRDRIARQILKLQMEGKPIPKFDIQLPPRYIEMNQIRLLLQTDDQNNETVVKKEQ